MMYKFFVLFICTPFLLSAQLRSGRDYAFFFYVTDFQPGISDIPFTKTEAEELAAELSANYGFTCELVNECKKEDITNYLVKWNNKIQPDDQVLFFFSMHGYYDPDGDRGYLIPSDGVADDLSNYFKSWLSYDDLRTYLAPCKAAHILLALDACNSGSFGIRNPKNIPLRNAAENTLDCHTRVRTNLKLKTRQFISAAKKNDVAPQRSNFAHEILATLRSGYDKDGLILFEDLAYRLHKLKSPEPEDGTYKGHQDGGQFIFVRNNMCVEEAYSKDTTNLSGGPYDLDAWRTAKATNNESAFLEYLRNFPNGAFKDKANNALYIIRYQKNDEIAWEIASEHDTPVSYEKYLNEHPDGAYTLEARNRKKNLELSSDGMVYIRGGEYQMGCSSEQSDCDGDETPVHTVTVSDFYLGRYEVTQKLWKQIMGDNPSRFSKCDNCPVEKVSWDDVQIFLKKLNAQYPSMNYRLPTEAEWEYAAREGGNAVVFSNGEDRLNPAEINFDASEDYKKPYSKVGEFREKTVPVGSLNSPNALGLYDMSGNVWEWCSDWKGPYGQSPTSNPKGPDSGLLRVARGGSWYEFPKNCRVSSRGGGAPSDRTDDIGFRLARTP